MITLTEKILKPFTESLGCTSREHCTTCRNKENGREWRRKLGKLYALPGGEVDFTCPIDKPWAGEGIEKTFDRIVVINLKRRPDRLEAFQKRIAECNWPFRSIEIFHAIDGNVVQPPSSFKQGGGAWGCLQSHLQILQQAMCDGIESLLILEDDFVPSLQFHTGVKEFLANVPLDWDALMLGGQHMKKPAHVGHGIVRCRDTQRTHAYALRTRAIRALYKAWQVIESEHCDWVMGPVLARHRTYAPDPFLAGQAADHSDITPGNYQERFWSKEKSDTPEDSTPVPSDNTVKVNCKHFVIGADDLSAKCTLGVVAIPTPGYCRSVCKRREPIQLTVKGATPPAAPPAAPAVTPETKLPARAPHPTNPSRVMALPMLKKRIADVRPICENCEYEEGFFADGSSDLETIVGCSECTCGLKKISMARQACPRKKFPAPGPEYYESPHAGKQRLILKSHLSPGDIVMMTAAVRELQKAHPGKYAVAVDTSAGDLWQHNPHIVPNDEWMSGGQVIKCNYNLIHQSNQAPYHFIHGYVQDLEKNLGIRIPLTEFKGDIHLSQEEKNLPSPAVSRGVRGRYWVILAGGKRDFTAKWWDPAAYQKVVDLLAGKVHFIQCGDSDPGHWHLPLKNVTDLRGKTSIREFVRLMYWADGVICPVTFAMHLAAAVPTPPDRPKARAAVVIAGGREPSHWEAYGTHRFLHTIGSLKCCESGGCWKSRCQTVGDNDEKDKGSLCEQPIQVSPELRIPRCMHMITPEQVVAAVESYYVDGLRPYSLPLGEIPVSPLIDLHLPEPTQLDPKQPLYTTTPTIAAVVGTFGASPYIHLMLEARKRFWPEVPLLVSDDCSNQQERLAGLCKQYGAEFRSNARRMRWTVGDMSAYAAGLMWAKDKDILVKLSRRFIPLRPWSLDLAKLAMETQDPTFSNVCDHFNYGFRTECIGMSVKTWIASGALADIESHVSDDRPVFVEGHLHNWARKLPICDMAKTYREANPRKSDRNGYAPWDLLSTSRMANLPDVLWHDPDQKEDYLQAAKELGLDYKIEDFADPNGGEGLGKP
jgi:hypothetical protein